MKKRLCIISTVFNWHSTSVSSTEFNTELNTVCTVRDSTRWIEWKVQHEVFNSTRRGEWKLNTDCIKWKVLLLHCTPLHFRRVLHFYTSFTLSTFRCVFTLRTSFTLSTFTLSTLHFSGNEGVETIRKCQQTRNVGVVAEKNKYVNEIHFLHSFYCCFAREQL